MFRCRLFNAYQQGGYLCPKLVGNRIRLPHLPRRNYLLDLPISQWRSLEVFADNVQF